MLYNMGEVSYNRIGTYILKRERTILFFFYGLVKTLNLVISRCGFDDYAI